MESDVWSPKHMLCAHEASQLGPERKVLNLDVLGLSIPHQSVKREKERLNQRTKLAWRSRRVYGITTRHISLADPQHHQFAFFLPSYTALTTFLQHAFYFPTMLFYTVVHSTKPTQYSPLSPSSPFLNSHSTKAFQQKLQNFALSGSTLFQNSSPLLAPRLQAYCTQFYRGN